MFTLSEVDLNFVLLALTVLSIFKIVKWTFYPYYVPGIPIAKANTWLGFSNFKSSTKENRLDSHVLMYEAEEIYGKMFQSYKFGALFITVNDKFIAKHVFDNVLGKGFFHVSFVLFRVEVLKC